MTIRHALATAIAALLLAAPAVAQVKSNIQDDPRSSDCTENCIDAGYEWAIANTPEDEKDCEAANEEFAAGCDHWVQEQRDLAAPPLEEPMETDAPGPMPDEPPMPPEDNG